MNKKEFLNEKYLKLCQQLGDAVLKQEQLSDHISNLKLQIKSLNESFSVFSEYEASVSREKRETNPRRGES